MNISIVLRTKNEGEFLGKSLDLIRAAGVHSDQRWLIDSSSRIRFGNRNAVRWSAGCRDRVQELPLVACSGSNAGIRASGVRGVIVQSTQRPRFFRMMGVNF